MDNVVEGDAVNLSNYPAPRWHEEDGGDYIGTECVVITRIRIGTGSISAPTG